MSNEDAKTIDFNTLIGVHYSTQLLESLDWNESKLLELTDYVSKFLELNKDPEDATLLLGIVGDKWGHDVKDTLKSIFSIEAFNLNLITSRSDNVN